MTSPYKTYLEQHINDQVTLHRSNAPDVTGELIKISDLGCTLKQPGEAEYATHVFVAYGDIRGVTTPALDDDIVS